MSRSTPRHVESGSNRATPRDNLRAMSTSHAPSVATAIPTGSPRHDTTTDAPGTHVHIHQYSQVVVLDQDTLLALHQAGVNPDVVARAAAAAGVPVGAEQKSHGETAGTEGGDPETVSVAVSPKTVATDNVEVAAAADEDELGGAAAAMSPHSRAVAPVTPDILVALDTAGGGPGGAPSRGGRRFLHVAELPANELALGEDGESARVVRHGVSTSTGRWLTRHGLDRTPTIAQQETAFEAVPGYAEQQRGGGRAAQLEAMKSRLEAMTTALDRLEQTAAVVQTQLDDAGATASSALDTQRQAFSSVVLAQVDALEQRADAALVSRVDEGLSDAQDGPAELAADELPVVQAGD